MQVDWPVTLATRWHRAALGFELLPTVEQK